VSLHPLNPSIALKNAQRRALIQQILTAAFLQVRGCDAATAVAEADKVPVFVVLTFQLGRQSLLEIRAVEKYTSVM
jgi:hypothetical protein